MIVRNDGTSIQRASPHCVTLQPQNNSKPLYAVQTCCARISYMLSWIFIVAPAQLWRANPFNNISPPCTKKT